MSASKTIVQVLSEIQNELKAPKNQFNKFGNYKYRSCEDILEGLKPLTAKFGGFVSLSDSIEVVADRIYVKAAATFFYNSEKISTTAYAREPLQQKGMSDPQVTGSASSYARKYALNGLFAIDDTKDNDHDSMHQNYTKPQPINNAQRSELMTLIQNTNTDLAKFCGAYKIGVITELPGDQFEQAKQQLLKKLGQNETKA